MKWFPHNRKASGPLWSFSGLTGPRRWVLCLYTASVRLNWEFGLYPVIPTQTYARRINYNTSKNPKIMVRFNFLSSFSWTWYPSVKTRFETWIGTCFYKFTHAGFLCLCCIMTCKSVICLVLEERESCALFLVDVRPRTPSITWRKSLLCTWCWRFEINHIQYSFMMMIFETDPLYLNILWC